MDATTAAALYGEINLPALSFLTVAVSLLVILPISAYIGHSVGHAYRRKKIASGKEVDLVAGQTSLSAILALLGLLLAFSFSNALNVSQTRKITAIDEAAALSTVFSRADYLAEPGRTELKFALLEYAKTRVVPVDDRLDSSDDVVEFLDTSLRAQAKLWPLTIKSTADPLPPPIKTFVAGAMNVALDAHLLRMQAFSVPVSDLTQITLLAAAIAALFMLGNRSGLVGRSLTWRTFVFAGFLLVVMITIVDLHSGEEGFLLLDQTALLAVIFDMELGL